MHISTDYYRNYTCNRLSQNIKTTQNKTVPTFAGLQNKSKAITNSTFPNQIFTTVDRIKRLILSAKEKTKNIEIIKAEYGNNISEEFVKSFQKDINEYFVGKNPNPDETVYDFKTYREQFKTFSEDEKLGLITHFANLNNGKYLNFWTKNPEKLSYFVNNTMYLPSQMKNFNPETWDAIISSFIKINNSDDKGSIINTIIKYAKDGYAKQINFLPLVNELCKDIINKLDNNQMPMDEYNKQILKLKSLIDKSRIRQNIEPIEAKFIDSQTKPIMGDIFISPRLLASNLRTFVLEIINKDSDENEIKSLISNLKKVSITATSKDSAIPLWRDDDIHFFDTMKLNGESVENLMFNAKSDISTRTKLLEYFNKCKPEIERNTFLSTAIKPHEFAHKNIKWNLELKEGVKYLYIEPFKCFSNETEAELLVHPCRLKIKNVDFKDNTWIFDADILPPKASS